MSKPEYLTFHELRAVNSNRARHLAEKHEDYAGWSPLEWAGAMCGEAGEVANLCKKLRRGDYVHTARIAEELADTVTYADLLADALDINLGLAVVNKFNVVSRRYRLESVYKLPIACWEPPRIEHD